MDRTFEGLELNLLLAKAPGQPLIWSRFLHQLIQLLHCGSAAMLVNDLADSSKTHFLYTAGVPQEFQTLYESKLNRLDDFNLFISKSPHCVHYNQILMNQMVLGSKQHDIWSGGQNHRFGVSLPCNQKHALSLLINRKTAFTEQEQLQAQQLLQGMIPALENAFHVEQRHKISSQLFHHLGEHFDGFIIVDYKLNIIFSDPVFVSIISQMECISISGQRFGMKAQSLEDKLHQLIEKNQESTLHNPCQTCMIRLIPIACLKNLYQWECYKDGYILIFMHDKGRNSTLERLADIYHLSRCEALCALQFMHLPSISDIAENTYRSQETVRNHIKHAMQKMDAHNQAEFMKKLLTLAAL